MHFVPQVLIVANAWAAGFTKQGVDIRHQPPPDIQAKYDALRSLLNTNQLAALAEIERNLVALQELTADVMLGDGSPKAIAAEALLGEIDKDAVRAIKWRERVALYG